MLDSLQQAKESLATKTAERLEELILQRAYKPGDKIPTEMELAQQLNVSRNTVREAVKALVARNVLEIRRGRGTFVAENTGRTQDPFGFAYVEDKRKLFVDLLGVRLAVEPWIAEEAARHASEEDIGRILSLCDQVEQLILSGKPHIEKDVEFHTAIAESTKNLVAPILVPIISQSVHIFGETTRNVLRTETIETHRATAEAIARHDPAAARAAMALHITYNRDNAALIAREIPE